MDLDFDRQHVWHPYSPIPTSSPVFPVVKTEGVYLYLEDGRCLVDGMSSWWSALHGYNHPLLIEAVSKQLHNMSHVMFGGLTHEPAIDLCKRLIELTSAPLQKVFLVDSGSVAVEVAIKMALQYWQAQGKSEKHYLLSLRNAYHGDTFATMSVCDPITGMHHLFANRLMPQYFTESPCCAFNDEWDDSYMDDFLKQIKAHHHELAAVILEPIVQGIGGMRFYSPTYLQCVRKICDEFYLLLIADEIATGFGRTGKLFACEHANISADILCLGKSMTGGMMTLAATLCTDRISQIICQGTPGIFMHGPTFMGNPLACAAANASIDLLLCSPWKKNIQRIEAQLKKELIELIAYKEVKDVRCLGAIAVIELKCPVDMAVIQPLFVKQGVWIRPFRELIYLMPPFISSAENIRALTQAVKRVIQQWLGYKEK